MKKIDSNYDLNNVRDSEISCLIKKFRTKNYESLTLLDKRMVSISDDKLLITSCDEDCASQAALIYIPARSIQDKDGHMIDWLTVSPICDDFNRLVSKSHLKPKAFVEVEFK